MKNIYISSILILLISCHPKMKNKEVVNISSDQVQINDTINNKSQKNLIK